MLSTTTVTRYRYRSDTMDGRDSDRSLTGTDSWRAGCRRRAVRFGGRAGKTDREQPRHRAPVRPNTKHPTREGKVYRAVVLDVFSRRVVGSSIDSSPTAAPVASALGMAIDGRRPSRGSTVIHSARARNSRPGHSPGRAIDSGPVPSMGSIGDCYDNAVIESFWSRKQVESLDRRRWKTRVELANAIFEYHEVFHNRQRRHSALGMPTPIEFETRHQQPISAARESSYATSPTRG